MASNDESEPRPRGRRVAALVRHGHFDRPEETASAHQLLPLSEEGREQAEDGAAVLIGLAETHGLEIDETIEASRLLRATETAWILAETLGRRLGRTFHVVEGDALLERGLGSAANLRFADIESLLAQDPRLDPLPAGWRRVPDFRLPVPGAESLMQAGRRAADRIDAGLDAIDGDDDRLRLFVAHSGCLRHAAVVRDALEIDRVSALKMDFVQSVLFERDVTGAWRQLAGDWTKRLPASDANAAEAGRGGSHG